MLTSRAASSVVWSSSPFWHRRRQRDPEPKQLLDDVTDNRTMVKTRSRKPRAAKEDRLRVCRRCGFPLRGDEGVAAQLDMMNAPTLTLEVARGLLDLLGL